jgi:hypothetical protein
MGEDVLAAVTPWGMDSGCGWGDHLGWAVPCRQHGGVLVGGTRGVPGQPGPSPIPGAETR